MSTTQFVAFQRKPGDRLYKHSHSWHFVQRWTPARILAADFGSVVCYREYTMRNEASKSLRPDFVIVDPVNKLVIVIEIKAGAAFSENQLAKYLTVANKELGRRVSSSARRIAFASSAEIFFLISATVSLAMVREEAVGGPLVYLP